MPGHDAGRPWERPCIRDTAAAAGLLALVAVACSPVFQAGFIWDDDAHVTAPALRSWEGLARIWGDLGATQQYYPLLHSLFWLEHRLWGDAAAGYHAANIVLHAAVAFLLGLTLRRLAIPGAFLAAAVFAVHPVHVESVAWISEQKNTLSAALYLGAALAFLQFETDRRRWRYVVATILFALALLAKSVTATLPCALLVVLWWRDGRLAWRRDGAVAWLAPWIALGLAAGLFTAWVEQTIIGARGDAYDLTVAGRLVVAGRALWFYVGKLLWPADLMFFYPRWEIDATDWIQWLPVAAGVAMAALLFRLRGRARAPLAAGLIFAGTLLPALGFLNVYPFRYAFVADHFVYLASPALIALVVGGAASATRPAGRPASLAALALIIALAALTWRQARIYRDAETLYRATIARNPAAWIAHNNLGKLLLADPARQAGALPHLERALELHPHYFEAHNNLAVALNQAGRAAEALPHAREAVRLRPDVYQAHNNLGIALASSGRSLESLDAFRRATELNPSLANIHENWAKALLLLERREEAAEHFARAAELRAAAMQRSR